MAGQSVSVKLKFKLFDKSDQPYDRAVCLVKFPDYREVYSVEFRQKPHPRWLKEREMSGSIEAEGTWWSYWPDFEIPKGKG